MEANYHQVLHIFHRESNYIRFRGQNIYWPPDIFNTVFNLSLRNSKVQLLINN